MLRDHRIAVFLPTYNTAKPLAMTLQVLPQGIVDDLIVVDDGSKDDSVAVGRSFGATVISHPQNRGYGSALRIQKITTLTREAYAEEDADLILPAWEHGLKGVHTLTRLEHLTVLDAKRRILIL